MHKHKAKEFYVLGELPATKNIQISWKDWKKVQKLIRLKSQPILIYLASYTE